MRTYSALTPPARAPRWRPGAREHPSRAHHRAARPPAPHVAAARTPQWRALSAAAEAPLAPLSSTLSKTPPRMSLVVLAGRGRVVERVAAADAGHGCGRGCSARCAPRGALAHVSARTHKRKAQTVSRFGHEAHATVESRPQGGGAGAGADAGCARGISARRTSCASGPSPLRTMCFLQSVSSASQFPGARAVDGDVTPHANDLPGGYSSG